MDGPDQAEENIMMGPTMNERVNGYTSQKWKGLSFFSSPSNFEYDASQRLSLPEKRKGLYRDEGGDGRPIKQGTSNGGHAIEDTQSANIGSAVAGEQHSHSQ